MYEWLEKELAEVKTPRFHLVDGPVSEDVMREVLRGPSSLPPSYREFIFRFGNARLYKQASAYSVGVRAVPDQGRSETGELLRRIGHFDDANAYLKEELLRIPEPESPVFEWTSHGLTRIAGSFADWLEKRADAARRRYGHKRWAEIVRGPEPFSQEEWAIVDARRRFEWRLLGVGDDSVGRFEVANNSPRTLPFLSIGIRSRDGRVSGGIWLPVSDVTPGAKAVVKKECYKGVIAPHELEAFPLADPEPQDRDRYWEFRAG
jgi:hypothetical protein